MESWLTSSWTHSRKLDIAITMDIQDIGPLKQNDKELMKIFIQAGFRGTDLQVLNQCRMYLQVTYLSEICSRLGIAIDKNWWDGQGTPLHTNYVWPRVHKPIQSEWNIWCQALQTSLNLWANRILPLPLGKWANSIRQ